MKYLLVIVFAICLVPNVAQADVHINHTSICAPIDLIIGAGDGKETIPFSMEIANTPTSMQRGLMFREFLPTYGGMIFVFDQPQIATFWMKNTLIPLDMLFVAADGEIITIHQNARPHDLTPLTSYLPVKYGIELRGGTVKTLDIQTGDYFSGFNEILGE
jgi:hypothetical protein